MSFSRESGYSLLEVVFVTGLVTTGAGVAAGTLAAHLDELKTSSAARYMAAQLQRARMQTVSRGANIAVRFVREGESIRYGVYMDGDGDGVRSSDIEQGIDRAIQAEARLADEFPGVDFGTVPDLPPVDPSSTPPGADPIRLGSADMASFTPLGTSTAGSLYVLGPQQRQYVIRLFGETGKCRILRFNATARQWEPF